jgi:lipoprotein-releasing system permease protein
MANGILFHIARTHLVSRMRQSIVSASGVMFGIGMYIALMGFMTALNDLLDGLILRTTPHIRIYKGIAAAGLGPIAEAKEYQGALHIVHHPRIKPNNQKLNNTAEMLDILERNPEVVSFAPRVQGQVFYRSGTQALNGQIYGISPKEENRLFNLDALMLEGKIEKLSASGQGIIIGKSLADKLSLKLGDRLNLTTTGGNNTAFRVMGIYQTGVVQIDEVISYAHISEVRKLIGEGQYYTTDINIKIRNIENATVLAKGWAAQWKVDADDINTINAQFETGSSIRMMITGAVSIALMVVAGFGIYNILNMMIYEKMNDIAILKATGFSGSDVSAIFLIQALLIGFFGALAGLTVGFLLSLAIDQVPFDNSVFPGMNTLPVNYNPLVYAAGLFFAIMTTFLAGYFPSRKASKIDPVDIIRGKA